MSNDPMRIHVSLVSHTNIGKTTLARTLLSRDIGEVADRAHVTETTDDYVLARTPEGCELILWDTPGFGNSVALAKRLEGRANPVGWFLSEVWGKQIALAKPESAQTRERDLKRGSLPRQCNGITRLCALRNRRNANSRVDR